MPSDDSTIYDVSHGNGGPEPVGLPPHLAKLVRTDLTAERFEEFYRVAGRGFQEEPSAAHMELERAVSDPARFFGFATGDRWISTFGSYARQLTVPGGDAIPVSAVTSVTVHSGYRRRGLLRQSMTEEFRRCRERGESLAVLYASESSIYGRFGYGAASFEAIASGRTANLRLRPDVEAALDSAGGSVDEVTGDQFLGLVRDVHDRGIPARPGMLDRPDAWWRVKLSDPPPWRDGATSLRHVVGYDAAGHVDGQATYQFKSGTESGNPAGEVRIREVEAESALGNARLWRYLANLDLARTLTVTRLPTDAAVFRQVADPRTITTRMQDGLYVRVVDVPAALAARRYAAPIDIVLEIADDALPEAAGRFALRGGTDGADCMRSDKDPDISLSARDLGSAYLGGTSLAALHSAGLVAEHRPGVVAAATTAFGWPVAPFCADMF